MKVGLNQYLHRLSYSARVVTHLNSDKYPMLHKFLYQRNETMLHRLLFIIKAARSIENQERGEWGYWFFLPLSAFAEAGHELASTKKTWEKTIILFTCMGLLERSIPTEDTATTPYRRRAVQYASETGHARATAFYSIPEYSTAQLDYIEQKARRWIISKANLQHFSKSTVLDIFGSAVADRVYQDERRTPKQQIDAEQLLTSTLHHLLENQPFTSKSELLATAAAGTTSPGKLRAVWERKHYAIIESENAKHRRPTDSEKRAHSLTGNGWIITRKDSI